MEGKRRGRVTMAEVARAAGVSTMTVSYAYNRPSRVSAAAAAKVRRAAAELGYPGPHPSARSLRRGRAGSLGVVLGEPLAYAFEDPQAARFLAGVAEVCAEAAVGLSLVPLTGDATDATRVTEAAVDGFVVWTTSDDDPVLDAVAATGLPAVVHGGPARPGLPVVGIDDRASARAVGHVAFAAGASHPAVLSFPLDRARRARVQRGLLPEEVAFPVTRHRLAGLRDAWEDLGGDWSDVVVAVRARNAAGEGIAAARELLEAHPRIDALAAMSDELALGALHAAREGGVAVPGELAVSGWDDSAAAAPAGLTTVRQDLRAHGRRCARIALELDEDDPSGDASALAWEVVRRETTRAPGGGSGDDARATGQRPRRGAA